jgi:hypothetical protein
MGDRDVTVRIADRDVTVRIADRDVRQIARESAPSRWWGSEEPPASRRIVASPKRQSGGRPSDRKGEPGKKQGEMDGSVT